jgi:hypothetical protein
LGVPNKFFRKWGIISYFDFVPNLFLAFGSEMRYNFFFCFKKENQFNILIYGIQPNQGANMKPQETPTFQETPLFSQDGLSVSMLSFSDDAFISFISKNILVLRQEASVVTEEAQQRLPDGIRGCQATHLILKVIYDSQPNKEDFVTALAYQSRYQQTQALTDKEVQLFVVSVQTPSQETRDKFGYQNTRFSGVYDSQAFPFTEARLISLNELSAEPHNAAFKCFASLKKERQQALEVLKQSRPNLMPAQLDLLLSELSIVEGEYTNFTPEQVLKMGKGFGEK